MSSYGFNPGSAWSKPQPKRGLMSTPDTFSQSSLAKLGGMMQQGQTPPQGLAAAKPMPNQMTPGLDFARNNPPPGYGADGGRLPVAGLDYSRDVAPPGSNTGGVLGAAGVSLPSAAPKAPAADGHAVPYVDPTDLNRTATAGLARMAQATESRQNPYLLEQGLEGLQRQYSGLAANGAINASHAKHAALLGVLRGGGLRSGKDMANLSDNQYAIARNNQDNLIAGYTDKLSNWDRTHDMDARSAYGDLIPAAASVYDLKDRNRDSYIADQTQLDKINAIREGYRQPGLANQGTANENAMAPQRQAEAEARIAQLRAAAAAAERAGNWQLAGELGQAAAALADSGAGQWIGGAVGSLAGPVGTVAGGLAGAGVDWLLGSGARKSPKAVR